MTLNRIYMKNICIVVGARPNFMKVAPLVRAIINAREKGEPVDYRLVYTGKEDDPTLEPTLYDDLGIKRPDAFLGVDCVSLNELTGQVMGAFERYLAANQTDIVIVVDDLASTMAVSIVTKKAGVRLAHLVAGTRSFDINMPKEINRLVIDGLSDMLFTAGAGSSSVATRAGAELSRIYMVGNILMDTLRYNHGRLCRPALWDSMGLEKGKYMLFTLNRRALMDNEDNLRAMLRSMAEASAGMMILAPLRGRARETVERLMPEDLCIRLIEPLKYLEFGYLAANAVGVVTDSGNVAEEATFNNVPCITLNSYTEHVETVKTGTNVLVGENAAMLFDAVKKMLSGEWKHGTLPDRWDGRTAERILHCLLVEEK